LPKPKRKCEKYWTLPWNVLVDAEKVRIVKEALSEGKESESNAELIYGDGQAGKKIAEILTRQA